MAKRYLNKLSSSQKEGLIIIKRRYYVTSPSGNRIIGENTLKIFTSRNSQVKLKSVKYQ